MSLMSLRSRSRICLMNLMIYCMEEVGKRVNGEERDSQMKKKENLMLE